MSRISKFITRNIDPSYREEILEKIPNKEDIIKLIPKEEDLLKHVPSVQEVFDSNVDAFQNLVDQEVKKRISESVIKNLKKSGVTVISVNSQPPKRIEGVTHEEFQTVLHYVMNNVPLFLSGPAGSGKNVICKQVAQALGLNFHFTNAVTQEYRLTGFIDARGVYHETAFYRAFKNGGLFFLDEIDASIPEVLVTLNAAIANRYFEFPNGFVEAHPDFRVVAAGNTYGGGADTQYTGRYQLDGASLDRFATVEIKYSPKIERAVTDNNTILVDFCHEFRKLLDNIGVDCIFSYRALQAITTMEKVLPLKTVLKGCLLKGMDEDTLHTIQGQLQLIDSLKTNKYALTLLSC